MDNKIIVNGQVVAHSSNSYNNLDEVTLPMINSAKLIGNLTSSELNMYTKAEVEKLVASARSVKLVENYPSSPSAGILYYVGTEAPYQVCTYSTDTLARIDLGSTETDLSEYVKLIPSHKDETGKVIYEIGHNEGIDDGRELVAHSVTGIINEIDTALQDRVNVLENDLTTENKKVVEAINELKDGVDTRVTKKIDGYKNKSPQDIFNEVFEEGVGFKCYSSLCWGTGYTPTGVGSNTTGGCVVHVNGDKNTAENNRWGAMYWQNQGNGNIYVCYLKQNVAQSWQKIKFGEDSNTIAGDFVEIKNNQYTYTTRGGTIQMNDQRDSLCFMFGMNMQINVLSNPKNITITKDDAYAVSKGYTYGIKWKSLASSADCYVLWKNTSPCAIHFEETNANQFGRHLITCTTKS